MDFGSTSNKSSKFDVQSGLRCDCKSAIPNSNGIKSDTEFAKTAMNELNVLPSLENEPFFLAFSRDIQMEDRSVE